VDTWFDRVDVITLFVDDVVSSKAFYRDVFGLAPAYEDADSVVFRFGDLMVNLLATTSAYELIEPAVVARPASGSRFQLTIHVEDVDVICAELAERGVCLLSGPVDRPWGVRTASFTDPDGHIWEIAR
jgi:catechol 2,3-dioxygenase-like lactoylglutathione lyase family enzyme